MNSDFIELLKVLNKAKARYLIVGGYAVIKYTEPRYTKDLDIWISPDVENAERIFFALTKFGAPLQGLTAEDFTNPNNVYHMGRSPLRVDILMSMKGLSFEDAWKNRTQSSIGNFPTQFLSLQDLIINKQLAGRPQDLIDADNLLLAQNLNSPD